MAKDLFQCFGGVRVPIVRCITLSRSGAKNHFRPMDRHHRCLLLCFLLLPALPRDAPAADAAEADGSLGVRLEGSLTPPAAAYRLDAPLVSDREAAAGRLLLHRRGCTGCHDLDLPAYPHTRGPRLDGIGGRTHAGWLDLWLREPTAYLPASRMPRVALGDSARSRLVAWLSHLGPEPPADSSSIAGDPYRGQQLFEALRCAGCHAGGGEGGDIGPALDRLGWKAERRWLRAALLSPGAHGLGSGTHPYDLSERDATDLSAYLLRRFAPPGGPDRSVIQDTSAVAAGRAAAVEHGCFQCHRVDALAGPRLRLPVERGRARTWLSYHEIRRGPVPSITIGPVEADAMSLALSGEQDSDTLAVPFWRRPVPPQGEPSPLFGASRRLEPGACAACHVEQARQWRDSRHAGTFSPGLRAQLLGRPQDFVAGCLACHAPRREQIGRALEVDVDDPGPAGVDCSTCHLRQHRVFGPGRPADPARPVARVVDGRHHGGVEAAPDLFADDAFCAPCHQFDEGGLAPGGKLLQNTYAEWRASPAARQPQTCQDCHMPGGDHAMRGIHDRDLVREALAFEARWLPTTPPRLSVRLGNVGAGHALPTYATAALLVKVFLSDEHDGVIESSLRTRAVQRRLSLDGRREIFDTRIPAGGAWIYEARFHESDLAPAPEARFVNVLVEVDPDHFYRRFFAALELPRADARVLLERARGGISDSPYILFARQIRLPGAEALPGGAPDAGTDPRSTPDRQE